MEDTDLTEQHNRYTAPLALRDHSVERLEERFNVLPGNVRAGRARIDSLECLLVTALHHVIVPWMGTTRPCNGGGAATATKAACVGQ